MMKLKIEYAHLNEMSLIDLIEEIGSLGGGDDWDGAFTSHGRAEFEYAKELCKFRIEELKMNMKSLSIDEFREVLQQMERCWDVPILNCNRGET